MARGRSKESKMANELTVQYERAFQKQKQIFLGKKRVMGKKEARQADLRYVKKVGLGIRTPKEASEGSYIDKKCPFVGDVTIRGRILRGVVISTHMRRTIVVRRDYLHFIPKYQRFEKRHKNIVAHCSPAFRTKVGDTVTLGECRPLSKTVRFNVLKVVPHDITALQKKKQFRPL